MRECEEYKIDIQKSDEDGLGIPSFPCLTIPLLDDAFPPETLITARRCTSLHSPLALIPLSSRAMSDKRWLISGRTKVIMLDSIIGLHLC